MATNNVGGIVSLTIDGVHYPIEGSVRVSPQTISRSMKTGADGLQARSAEAVNPKMTATLRDFGGNRGTGLPLAWMLQQTDLGAITARQSNGTTWTLSGGTFIEGQPEPDTMNATVEVTFLGSTMRQGSESPRT